MRAERQVYYTDNYERRMLVVRTPGGWLVTHWIVVPQSVGVHSVQVEDKEHAMSPDDFAYPSMRRCVP